MSDFSVKTSLSPGETQRAKREEELKSHARGQMISAFLRGDISGEQVERLTKLIAGTPEDRGHAEMELALNRMLKIQATLIANTR